MIYMMGERLRIVILESASFEGMRQGQQVVTPDESVVIGWTPDPVWLSDQFARSDGNFLDLRRLIVESASRPQAPPETRSPVTRIVRFNGDPGR